MSENIPESIPTSTTTRSHGSRPTKKRALNSATSQQSAQVEALFANPDRAATDVALGPRAKNPAIPPEIVANVQGSSAGAGSGEFHVYKASRRREYERLRAMDDEVRSEEAEERFRREKEEREAKDAEKLSKNRARREKAKKRLEKKKAGVDDDAAEEGGKGRQSGGNAAKKKLGPAKIVLPSNGEHREENGDGEQAQEEVGITIHDDD